MGLVKKSVKTSNAPKCYGRTNNHYIKKAICYGPTSMIEKLHINFKYLHCDIKIMIAIIKKEIYKYLFKIYSSILIFNFTI